MISLKAARKELRKLKTIQFLIMKKRAQVFVIKAF